MGPREASITVALSVSYARVLLQPGGRGAMPTRRGRSPGGCGAVRGARQRGGSPGGTSGRARVLATHAGWGLLGSRVGVMARDREDRKGQHEARASERY